MFTQFHNLFAQKHNFLFLMANQVQRHAAARGVALRVKTDPWSFKAFSDMVSDADEYMEKLRLAKEDPTSKEARELLKHVMRFVGSAGKQVPWSGEERAAEITKLYAMCRRFGPGSCFLTCAPDDVHQPRSILLSYRAGRPDEFPVSPARLLPVLRGEATAEEVEAFCTETLRAAPDETYEFRLDEPFLQRLATLNPVATTLFYEQLAEAIFTHLVGMPPSHKRKVSRARPGEARPRGFLGAPFGWSFITETNARKSFHFHASVNGGASPALLADVVGYPALEKLVCQALDSIYSAHVPMDLHAVDTARRLLKCPPPKHTFYQTTELPDDASCEAFERKAATVALHTGFHTHATTCRKGASGKLGCRMARPAGHPVPSTRVLSITRAGAEGEESHEDAAPAAEVNWRCPHCAPKEDGAPASGLRARRPQVGDAASSGLCLSYELHRPELTPDASGSSALRELLELSPEEMEALQPADRLAYVLRVVDDLSSLLEPCLAGPTLRDRLQNLDETDAEEVLAAWRNMACRNAKLVEYCPTLSGSVMSNTAPLLLGAGDTAKGAAMYMVKYMVKDAYALAASLSVLADARRHIDQYPSNADDAHTAARCTRHFLQRVLNAGGTELAPTQAAAIVLGVPSSGHSHSFVNSYVWDAVQLLAVVRAGGALLEDASVPPPPPDVDVEPDASAEGEDKGGSEDEVDAADDTGLGRKGTCSIYTTPDGIAVPVSQPEHYAHRNELLAPMNFDEFVMSMHITKKPPQDKNTDGRPNAGRPATPCYALLPTHPLAEHYDIKQKAKFDVPILVGAPPPRLPPKLPAGAASTPARNRKAHDHARYFSALFVPWTADSPVDATPASWQAFLADLQQAAATEPTAPAEVLQCRVAQGRLFRIEQVSRALTTHTQKARVMTAWRLRNRTLWDETPVELDTGTASGAGGLARDAERDIAEIREEAAQRGDPRAMRRAANMETWAQTTFASLEKLSAAAQPGQTWHRRAPPCDGAPTLPLPAGPDGLQQMLAAMAKSRVSPAPAPPTPGPPPPADPSSQTDADEDEEPPEFRAIDNEHFRCQVAEWKRLKDALPHGSVPPPPPLNPPQRAFAREHLALQRALVAGRRGGEEPNATLQKLRDQGLRQIHLLQGAGGVGKSVLLAAMERVMRRLGLGTMVVTAWTGVASAPFGTPTLCSLLKINFSTMAADTPMTEEHLNIWRAAFTDAACDPGQLLVFTIDEASFLVPESLHHVDVQLRRLRGLADVPFGGVALLLAGDFWQKPPPSSTSMAEILAATDMRGLAPPKPVDPMSTRAKGLTLFRQARRTVLTQQMRAADDPDFQAELVQLRDTASDAPVPSSLVDALQEVSPADVVAHPPFAFATIAVLSNYERQHLNRKQAEAFARAHNLPLVLWKLPLTGRAAELVDAAALEELYENEPGLWGAFVRGAPAMMTENIQPTKFLVNGAAGFMHSLSFSDKPPPELADALASTGFSIVQLEKPPLCVNFQVTLPDGEDGEGIETLVADAIVVPIVVSKHTEVHDTVSLWACVKGVPKHIRYKAHPCTLAFAVTDFKLQGKTLDELILSVAPRPFTPHLDLKGFYVAVSRVRTRGRLRVLHRPPRDKGGLGHLYKLTHTKELAAWNRGYSESGDWDPAGQMAASAAKAKGKGAARKRSRASSS